MFRICIVFFKQKTAYEMRISDWSSDVCSSDLCLPNSNRGSKHLTAVSSKHGRMADTTTMTLGARVELQKASVLRITSMESFGWPSVAAETAQIGMPPALVAESGRDRKHVV